MSEVLTEVIKTFRVICTWCGKEIRTDQIEDSCGTCLDCFYRIVAEQLHSQRPLETNQFASDR